MTAIYALNPISGARRHQAIVAGQTLADLAPEGCPYPFYAQRNAVPVLRGDWAGTVLDEGDRVEFIALPLLPQGGGGGGGGGGKNPIAMVAQIALMVVAPEVGLLAGEVGTFANLAARAAFSVIGGMVITALTVDTPRATAAQQAQTMAAPSPTYSLQAQGNQARLGQPIPEMFGRHIIYPDFAADPYGEYAGNEQFLYQLFCLGQGAYDIESMRIEDTAIASFPEVTYEVIQPGGTVTLFPALVNTSVEVTGQEMTTGTYIGGFIANDAGTLANALGLDFVFPRGLYYANSGGGLDAMSVTYQIEARTVDNSGTPTSGWAVLETLTTNGGTNTPIRISRRYTVAEARYEVRVKRTDTKSTDARAGHEILWAGLRAYLPGAQTYGNVTLVAVRMQASNSLSSQSSRRFNVIATRKLPTWNPSTGWSAPTATRSIAWAFAYVARSSNGLDYADDRLPLDELYALDATWTSRGDHFDAVFDSKGTAWEALQQIARAGRAKPYPQGGLLRIARDEPQTTPAAVYSMRNILPGSFAIDYVMPSDATADCVEVEFFNATTWKWDRVTAALPGSSSTNPAKVKLFGVTNHDHAWREGMFIAACNVYRRRAPTWATGMEGMIPSYLDLILVQHDMPQWAQQAEAVAWDAGTRVLQVSEPLTFTTGTHYVGFRKKDGSFAGPYPVLPGVDAWHVVLGADPAYTPYCGDGYERTHVTFGPATGAGYGKQCRLTSAKPAGGRIEMTAVVEDSRVHTADATTPPTPGAAWGLVQIPDAPAVSGVYWTVSGIDEAPTWNVSWKAAAGATGYLVEQSPDGSYWTRAGDTAAGNLSFVPTWPGGRIRVAAIGKVRGTWVTKTTPDRTRTLAVTGAMNYDSDTPGLLVPTLNLGSESATLMRFSYTENDINPTTTITDLASMSFSIDQPGRLIVLTRSHMYGYTLGSLWQHLRYTKVDYSGGSGTWGSNYYGYDIPEESHNVGVDVPAGTITITMQGYHSTAHMHAHRIYAFVSKR